MTKTTLSQATKIQVGISALLVWGILGLSGNLGANSALIFFKAAGGQTKSVNLSWSAPGEDNNSTSTAATAYDIRYSTAALTEANWGSATTVSGEPTPAVMGTTQSMQISGLTAGTTYYFGLKSVDASGNWSALSNVAVLTIPSGGGGKGGPPDKPKSTGGNSKN